jgi:hypothetical protein
MNIIQSTQKRMKKEKKIRNVKCEKQMKVIIRWMDENTKQHETWCDMSVGTWKP